MGFREDLLGKGIKGRFYVDTKLKDTIYCVDEIVKIDQGDFMIQAFVLGTTYDLGGNRTGVCSKNLVNCLEEDNAPEGFTPKKEEPESLILDPNTNLPMEDWGPYGKNPLRKDGGHPHPWKKY